MTPESLCMGCMADKGNARFCGDCGWQEGTAAESPQQLPPRTVLDGRYLLGRALGQGGFGITYLAWDLNLNRKLAVKEYFPREVCTRARDEHTVQPLTQGSREAYADGQKRFLEEARALARFQDHPGIVSVLGFFQENGTAYLVMAYVEGLTFKQYLEEQGGKIRFERALDILVFVMDALREVHGAGLLHRDISPDNIYLNRRGQVKILDFGAARYAMGELSRSLDVILKPGYAPAEQYRHRGKQGPWTDVYALGATLYRAVIGQTPTAAPDRLEHDDLVPPSRLGVEIPAKSEEVLLKALAVRHENRFQTVADFQNALMPREILKPKPVSPPEPVLDRLTPWPDPWRRLKRVVFALAVAVLVLAAAAVIKRIWPRTGRVTLTANVVGAHISIDGRTVPDWVTPHTFANLPGGPHRITVMKDRYQAVSQDVTVQPGGDSSVNVNLLPATQVGQLTVAASSAEGPVVGAKLLMDDESQPDWLTPHTFSSLPAGPHRVTVMKDGYQAVSQNVTVQAGGDGSVNLNLLPSPPQVGQLTVAANVAGAKISIDGQTEPDWLTPHTFSNLPGGAHRIAVMKNGYPAVSQNVTVQLGQAGSVTLNLSPLRAGGDRSVGSSLPPGAQLGGLTVTSNVSGARIRIDGQAQPGWVTPHTFDRLLAGNHVVAVEEDFYRTASRVVVVPADGSVSVDLPITQGTGRVKISTNPPGLQVSIDGQPRGQSPLVIENVIAGHHRYRIEGPPGREPKEDTVDIHDGESWEKIVRWE